jgi:hypothetical protein
MSTDAWRTQHRAASVLKFRAQALILEGTEEARFEGSVLLHEAADLERRALVALQPVAPAHRLQSTAEVCACLLAGFDPPGASEAWDEVVAAAQEVEPSAAAALLQDLQARLEQDRVRFARLASLGPLLPAEGHFAFINAAARVRLRKALQGVLTTWPGMAAWWFTRYQLDFIEGQVPAAVEAIGRALRLAPGRSLFRAMQVDAVSRLDAEQARALMREAAAAPGDEPGRVYLINALTGLRLDGEQGTEALVTIERGLAAEPPPDIRRLLITLRLYLGQRKAGHSPELTDVLHQARLGRLVPSLRPEMRPLDNLLALARQAA